MSNEFEELDAARFKMIKEMSKEEVINELTAAFHDELTTRDSKSLRELLVRTRVGIYKDRTLREAGLKEEAGFFFGNRIVEDYD